MYDHDDEFRGDRFADNGEHLSAEDNRIAGRAIRYATDPSLLAESPFRPIVLSETPCPRCGGEGHLREKFCHPCHGTGRKGGEGRNRVPVPRAVFEITDPTLL